MKRLSLLLCAAFIYSNTPSQEKSLKHGDSLIPTDIRGLLGSSGHSELIINGTEDYDFNTTNMYTHLSPDHRRTVALYGQTGDPSSLTAVNETSYFVSGTDSTNVTYTFNCSYSLLPETNLNSEGTCSVSVNLQAHLPDNCEIEYDNRTLDDLSSYFQLSNYQGNTYPEVGHGILLHRSNGTGNFTTWDGFVPLDSFITTPTLQIQFSAGLYVQLAILYEIHNWDNGWWIFQNHKYYHNIGIYSFRTSYNHLY
ncbi:MAG: hypothetical protein IKP56_01185 [Bacilli bacterium]|nr:hypothetical protein [Bacilli bacterium]